jgi:hypothetical protein
VSSPASIPATISATAPSTSAVASSALHTVCLPCFPSGNFPLLCDAAWDEMFEAFIDFAKRQGLSIDRHERPMLFKDRRTKAVWSAWKTQWTALRIEMLSAKENP